MDSFSRARMKSGPVPQHPPTKMAPAAIKLDGVLGELVRVVLEDRLPILDMRQAGIRLDPERQCVAALSRRQIAT